MTSDIDIQVDRMWQNATAAAKRCEAAYKEFLTSLHLFADLIDHDPEVILREALGNTEKRKTEESIGLWLGGVEEKWKATTEYRLWQAERNKRKRDLLSKLNLTNRQCALLGIEIEGAKRKEGE